MLLASGKIEVKDEDGRITNGDRGKEDGKDMTMGLGADGESSGTMSRQELWRDKGDNTSSAIALVRVDGIPGGKDGGE